MSDHRPTPIICSEFSEGPGLTPGGHNRRNIFLPVRTSYPLRRRQETRAATVPMVGPMVGRGWAVGGHEAPAAGRQMGGSVRRCPGLHSGRDIRSGNPMTATTSPVGAKAIFADALTCDR